MLIGDQSTPFGSASTGVEIELDRPRSRGIHQGGAVAQLHRCRFTPAAVIASAADPVRRATNTGGRRLRELGVADRTHLPGSPPPVVVVFIVAELSGSVTQVRRPDARIT